MLRFKPEYGVVPVVEVVEVVGSIDVGRVRGAAVQVDDHLARSTGAFFFSLLFLALFGSLTQQRIGLSYHIFIYQSGRDVELAATVNAWSEKVLEIKN